MDLLQAMNQRHSVRSYTERPIEGKTKEELLAFLARCGRESGLRLRLVLDEPAAFDGFMAHYGKFSGVRNYIMLAGEKGSGLDEKCGYYGEKIVLFAQTLGLNTCWVALTYSKGKAALRLDKGEKLCLVIAIGYGQTGGRSPQVQGTCACDGCAGDAPGLVHKGDRRGAARAHSHESAKICVFFEGQCGDSEAGSRLLQQGRSRHCEVPL